MSEAAEEAVLVERRDRVMIITLNRPESMNSFNTELRADVVEALERARDDDAVRAIVFTGEGRCFSAGADLKAGIDRDLVHGFRRIVPERSTAGGQHDPFDVFAAAGRQALEDRAVFAVDREQFCSRF